MLYDPRSVEEYHMPNDRSNLVSFVISPPLVSSIRSLGWRALKPERSLIVD